LIESTCPSLKRSRETKNENTKQLNTTHSTTKNLILEKLIPPRKIDPALTKSREIINNRSHRPMPSLENPAILDKNSRTAQRNVIISKPTGIQILSLDSVSRRNSCSKELSQSFESETIDLKTKVALTKKSLIVIAGASLAQLIYP
jgi:hypothetical protein